METKSFKKIMEDLGFNENAKFETKKAFLKYLFEQANSQEKKAHIDNKSKYSIEEHQMSLFDVLKNKNAG